jgi:hypothetical protein
MHGVCSSACVAGMHVVVYCCYVAATALPTLRCVQLVAVVVARCAQLEAVAACAAQGLSALGSTCAHRTLWLPPTRPRSGGRLEVAQVLPCIPLFLQDSMRHVLGCLVLHTACNRLC